jgi:iron(III) transport system permease protein
LVIGIFRTAPIGLPGEWTLSEIGVVATEEATYTALANSAVYATATTLLATASGSLFAFLATRTTVHLRSFLTPIMLLALAMPTLLYAISWSMLANPAVGVLNVPFKEVFGIAPLNAETWPGLVLVQSLKLTSFSYMLLLGPFATMNRSYEEASLVAGASRLGTLLRIDLPVLAPAIFGVVIILLVFGLGAFDVPQLLGGPAGVTVLSTRIYQLIGATSPPRYAAAAALALFMVAALFVLLAVQWRVTRGRQYVTITGKSYSAARWNLGKWSAVGSLAIVAYGIAALVLPAAQVVLTALQPALGLNERLGLGNFEIVLADPRTPAAIQVTILLAVTSGFAAMALATVLGYIARRTTGGARTYITMATLLPIAMPGVVLAVGILWAYIMTPGLRELYGTVWLAVIALIVGLVPIASRASHGALVQVGRELEEAAEVAGASRMRVLFDVVLRSILPSFVAGWVVAAIIAAGTLDVPLLLLPAGDPNVAVLAYALIYSAGFPTRASALLVILLLVIAAIGIAYLGVAEAFKRSSRGPARIRR